MGRAVGGAAGAPGLEVPRLRIVGLSDPTGLGLTAYGNTLAFRLGCLANHYELSFLGGEIMGIHS